MLRKLLSLFAPARPFVPPTKKQIDYAKLCGINIRLDMDRDSVSRAIDAAFASDPKLQFKISARRKRDERQAADQYDGLPGALKREFKEWEAASEEYDHFLVVYSRGKDLIVDILVCHGVRMDRTSGTLIVDFLSPRIENVVIGNDGEQDVRRDELCWDQSISINSIDIAESQRIEIDDDQIKKYQSAIKHKLDQLKNE